MLGGMPRHGYMQMKPTGNNVSAEMIRDQEQEGDQKGKCNAQTGQPVNIRTGTKVFSETDFVGGSEMPLLLSRTYSGSQEFAGSFGPKWSSSIDYKLGFLLTDRPCLIEAGVPVPAACSDPNRPIVTVRVYRPNGARYTFKKNSITGYWVEVKAETIAWMEQLPTTWVLHNEEGGVETYDLNGRPLSILNDHGIGWTFAYVAGSANQVSTITHTSGRQIQLTWLNSKVSTAIDPAGNTYAYSYNATGMLTGITYPGSLGSRT